jgi:hypothetical protein
MYLRGIMSGELFALRRYAGSVVASCSAGGVAGFAGAVPEVWAPDGDDGEDAGLRAGVGGGEFCDRAAGAFSMARRITPEASFTRIFTFTFMFAILPRKHTE